MGVAFLLVGGALGVACPGFLFWKVGSYVIGCDKGLGVGSTKDWMIYCRLHEQFLDVT